jgi:hypothetical protein
MVSKVRKNSSTNFSFLSAVRLKKKGIIWRRRGCGGAQHTVGQAMWEDAIAERVVAVLSSSTFSA